MSDITLSPQFIDKLNQAALEQAVQPEDILEDALQVYLRQLERQKIKAEVEAYRTMHADLVRRHLGQFVAIHQGQLVDHDRDFESLHTRIRHRFGRQPVLLRQVTPEAERVLVRRSPRLERNEP